MGMVKEFKEFAVKGNVVDLAVGVIIGGAFGTIVKSLVDDVIMPPVGLALGGVDFSDLFVTLREGTTGGPYPTLAAAKEAGHDVKTAKFPFSANGKAMGLGDAVGFVKVVADAEHNEIIGAHLIGPDVTELLPALTLAQKWDLTADEVARNVFAHPTLSEAVKEAVEGIAGHMINL